MAIQTGQADRTLSVSLCRASRPSQPKICRFGFSWIYIEMESVTVKCIKLICIKYQHVIYEFRYKYSGFYHQKRGHTNSTHIYYEQYSYNSPRLIVPKILYYIVFVQYIRYPEANGHTRICYLHISIRTGSVRSK